MGTLRMVTAKVGDLSLFDGVSSSNATLEVSGDTYRTPDYGVLTGKSFKVLGSAPAANGYGICTLAEDETELYVRIAFRIDSYTSSDITVCTFMEGATGHVNIAVNPQQGTVKALRSTAVLATSLGNVWAPYSWTCLEAYALPADSGGRVIVRINGSETAVIDFTGDTRNGAMGVLNAMRFGSISGGFNGFLMYFDDIMVRDDTWCGTGGIYLLLPNAAGDDSDWTASEGNAWDCVNELPPSFSDFIYTDSANSGDRSLFGVENLPVTPTTITSVGVFAKSRMTAPGSGTVKVALKSDATIAYGGNRSLDVGELWAMGFFDVDPDGDVAWSGAAVNAMQIGVENV